LLAALSMAGSAALTFLLVPPLLRNVDAAPAAPGSPMADVHANADADAHAKAD
jgi:hypothetical protein